MKSMQNLLLSTFIGFLILGQIASADIQIQSSKKKYSWKNEWTSTILEELKKDEYRVGEQAMLNLEIDEEDLNELECDGYNNATPDQKSEFWVVFFSALTRAESAFNPKARSRMSKGHRSLGLLQLARATAKSQCGIVPPEGSVLNPEDNLKCGIKLMSWQLHGAPITSGKKLRSDLEGQIFGSHMFQWGPLRDNDLRGRKLLTYWFKAHLDQLKFCNQKSKAE